MVDMHWPRLRQWSRRWSTSTHPPWGTRIQPARSCSGARCECSGRKKESTNGGKQFMAMMPGPRNPRIWSVSVPQPMKCTRKVYSPWTPEQRPRGQEVIFPFLVAETSGVDGAGFIEYDTRTPTRSRRQQAPHDTAQCMLEWATPFWGHHCHHYPRSHHLFPPGHHNPGNAVALNRVTALRGVAEPREPEDGSYSDDDDAG